MLTVPVLAHPLRSTLRWLLLVAPGLALVLLQTGATCTEQAPTSSPKDVHLVACVEYLKNRDTDRAETACELCLEYDEKSPECLNGMGLVWFYRGVDDKAREYFKKAINFNNDFAQARNNFGVLKFEDGDFEGARTLFASAIEIDPAYLDARYNLALSLLRLGQRERAAQAQKPKAQRDPAKELAFYDEAEKEYRKIFELAPNHAGANHDMGVIETYRAENSSIENKTRLHAGEAERYFKRCLEIDPAHETCHGNLAHLYLGVGRFDEALFHYIQCLAANKDNPICAAELNAAYSQASMQSESIRRYVDQVRENPGYAPAHYGLCQAFFGKGLVDMAVVECENTIKLDANYCMAYFHLAEHYRQVLDGERAQERCRSFISCAGEMHPEEVATCKETIQVLQAQ